MFFASSSIFNLIVLLKTVWKILALWVVLNLGGSALKKEINLKLFWALVHEFIIPTAKK